MSAAPAATSSSTNATSNGHGHADEEKHYSLQPGQTLVYDYRAPDLIGTQDRKKKLPDTLRVVQWNIERGAKLSGIIQTLAACEADIICLQELDIDCRRSGYVNVPLELARALRMQCVFVCEFEELDSPARAPHNAVGPLSDVSLTATSSSSAASEVVVPLPERLARRRAAGQPLSHLHGNAILSRSADISRDVAVLRHTTSFDWEQEGEMLQEPRHGYRSALRVTIDPLDRTSALMPPLYVYCCHLEVFSGGLARVRQLADCMADARRLLRLATGHTDSGSGAHDGKGPVCHEATPLTQGGAGGSGGTGTAAAAAGTRRRAPSFIIAGDLNTMAHGIVRLSPRYARDRMRVLSLGETEAMWLQRKVLARNMASVIRGCCPLSYRFPAYITARLYELIADSSLIWRFVYGFTSSEADRFDNRETCFYDPSDKYGSVTLNNPDYKGFVSGKLDWLLLSNLTPRPFRVSRGFARPVDVATLLSSGSLLPNSPSAAYLQRIYAPEQGKAGPNNSDDEAREMGQDAVARYTPRDGYVLFNEAYTDSDHKGLLMTIQQMGTSTTAEDAYPPYGAPYTMNVLALATFLLSRAIPLALVGGAALKLYNHMHEGV